MKKTFSVFILTMCMLAAPMGVNAQTLVFHLSGGAKSTVALPATFTVTPTGDKLVIDGGGSLVELAKDDVMCVTYRGKKGDVNEDETVDVADIATIISIMAGKNTTPVKLDRGKAPENVEAVDLGLPSGTLWANMNLGATDVPDAGLYYAWGKTTGYKANTSDGRKFNWASYKWMQRGKSDWQYVNKYQADDDYYRIDDYGVYPDDDGKDTGAIWYKYNFSTDNYDFIGDGKTILDPEDDAAHVTWEGDWHIPTEEDFKELLANTTSEWVTINSVKFRKFISTVNNKILFLPAAGRRFDNQVVDSSRGHYWSALLRSDCSFDAWSLIITSDYASRINTYRYLGLNVRPVLKK